MTSRQSEKGRRRQERLAREQAEARAAAQRRRLQMVFGGVLATAALVGVVLAVVVTTAGSDERDAASGDRAAALPDLPPQQISDVQEAADAAGCELVNAEYEGADHADKEFTAADYETNPPTSGGHTPDWHEDGVYAPGAVPQLGMLVHSLEHGRINVQYSPDAPEKVVRTLEAVVAETEGYHQLLYENTTDMPYEVAATAWTHLLGCPKYTPAVVDALRTFRTRYIDKGPESVP